MMAEKKLPPLGTKVVGKTSEGRKIIDNGGGSYSTERTVTILDAGVWYNIPTMFDGKEVSQRDAVNIMRKNNFVDPDTGRQIEGFKDTSRGKTPPQSAIYEAQNRSKSIKMIFDKPPIGEAMSE